MQNHNRNYEGGGMGSFGALLTGVFIGAAAVFFSDERNRRRMRKTMDDWKQKAEDARDTVEDKAKELKREGLERVSDELEKTQSKVSKARKSA